MRVTIRVNEKTQKDCAHAQLVKYGSSVLDVCKYLGEATFDDGSARSPLET